ncbi:uncharacterized protein NMK_3581 [Novimethylophilus kurashikiensis]|uniref:PglD N-terminal domain-containing protein n=1 Tax=Novimethylophilus kurashikiensis TaxID=1825523 RepID=A0A2R5FJH5_9PROT|nr:acetyltransferase [Novimethylophilus kurashikiensis]GBG15961.1 uncharacterized protein NMK_3581 [Novimethylophilus kurashikiensis]
MQKIVIYGNGAMARVLFSYAKHSMQICGFTVDDHCIPDDINSFCNLPLIPFSKVQDQFPPSIYKVIVAVGFREMNELREKKYEEAAEKGYSFARYIHESVIMHDDVHIADNCIILDHVSIHPGCNIGRGVFISSNVNIGHDCVVEPNCWINSGVSIAGGCHIGSGSFFGVNSSAGHGIRMGAQNFIAANTVITKNTNNHEVYLSEPGQLFRLSSKSFLKFSRIFD